MQHEQAYVKAKGQRSFAYIRKEKGCGEGYKIVGFYKQNNFKNEMFGISERWDGS